MAEYIEREEYCREHCNCNAQKCDKSSCPIYAIPAADVAPVVRCKDCLYWEDAIGFCHQNSQYYNDGESWDIYQPDDFCSRGERRTT